MEGNIQSLKLRAEEILEDLTLDEKIGMIHGNELFRTKGVPKLDIPPISMSDGPMGVRAEFKPREWVSVGNTDDYVSYLPCNSAIAATWDRFLAKTCGSVLGEETRGRGKDVILAPGINLKRTPLCGRNFEYYSEDPFLTSEMASEYIKGIQNWDVAACVKHFALNHQETARLEVDAEIDEEVLRDLYLQVFKDVIDKGNPYAIMTAYNKIYGEYCSESKLLLNEILRKEWGYEGFVVSDWGAVHDTKRAAEAEIDCEMSVTYDFDDYKMAEPLKKMVEAGEIDEALIDKKVLHILILMLRLNMIGEDRMERKDASYNTFSSKQRALDVARGSVILLKNEDDILPIYRPLLKEKRVLVVGENAAKIHSNGGGSAEIKALYELSPLMGLKARLGGGTHIDYMRGYCSSLDDQTVSDGTNWQAISLENAGGKSVDGELSKEEAEIKHYREALRKEVLDACDDYDYVIFVGGLNHSIDTEGLDRKNIDLPYEQNELLSALLDKRPDTVVTMVGGGVVNMTKWLSKCKALLFMYYNGMEGGAALAETIIGDVAPTGHLPETFYEKAEDCSGVSIGDCGDEKMVHYREGFDIGYRHIYKNDIPVQFPFGYGLTYSEFELDDLKYNKSLGIVKGTLLNIGDGDCSQVIQIYRLPDEKHNYLELVGFEKVYSKAGSSIAIEVEVKDKLGDGKYAAGFSSADLKEVEML